LSKSGKQWPNTCDKLLSMWAVLNSLLYALAIILAAVFLFLLVGELESNRRLEILLKIAIFVSAGATVANQLLPNGLLAAITQ
jgi:hypothetical protein